ncbi:MAG: hypothetical protein WCZ65_07350 [Lysobacteraceae bacterium]
MNTSRIPAYDQNNPDGMTIWFAEMASRDLLFHPEDDPESIIKLSDGTSLFTQAECDDARKILTSMFAKHGDGVIKACYPIFMRKANCLHALDA